jgi:EAL domain-containing protein (putative c-di-GMP-specific phosphodiesterase class I)
MDDAADAAIVQAIVALGHTLHLKVVAEGVETEPTARTLSALGCDELQGYCFSRPLPWHTFVAWVQAHGAPLCDATPAVPAERRRRQFPA